MLNKKATKEILTAIEFLKIAKANVSNARMSIDFALNDVPEYMQAILSDNAETLEVNTRRIQSEIDRLNKLI